MLSPSLLLLPEQLRW